MQHRRRVLAIEEADRSVGMPSTPAEAPLGSVDARGATVAVFDIGGTTFRAALYSRAGGTFQRTDRAAIGHRQNPGASAEALHAALVDYLVATVRRLRSAAPDVTTAAVSLGAALDANTSIALQSGPLWGAANAPFDILAALRAADPATHWIVLNDLTAALLGYVRSLPPGHSERRTGFLMIGSGIGFRVYDHANAAVPVDPEFGVQGEVGHLPVTCVFEGSRLSLRCECGGLDHLNAFASGRGIAAVIAQLATTRPERFARSALRKVRAEDGPDAINAAFLRAAITGDAIAREILDALTLPIATLLLNVFTIDPLIGHVALTGGVPHALGDCYRDALLAHLSRLGLYQVSSRDPEVFERRIRLVAPSDDLALFGVGEHALDLAAAPGGRRKLWRMPATRDLGYVVERVDGLLDTGNPALADALDAKRCLIACDEGFGRFHGAAADRYFGAFGIEAPRLVLPTSESAKDARLAQVVVDEMDAMRLSRRVEPLVAFGGGVLLDAGGFAASIYRRGIGYVRVPTTLIGLIDAGVGLKVGVNHGRSKNRLGAFYPPGVALLDHAFLRTLPERHLRNGAAEIVKLGIVIDRELFELMEGEGAAAIAAHFQGATHGTILDRAVETMLAELAANPFEQSLERLVDFGHTFSPGIEMAAADALLHGEAVAIDMALSVVISERRGWLSSEDAGRAIELIRALGLPVCWGGVSAALLLDALNATVVHRGGEQHIPLPRGGLGSAGFASDVTAAEVGAALSDLAARI